MRICFTLAALAAALWLGGCAVAPTPDAQSPGGMMTPVSPKEQLDRERLAEAIKGLRIDADKIVVEARTPRDAAAGEALRQEAERITEEQNTWFVSVGAFRDALLADPRNPKSYEGLARALLMEGNTEMARAALQTAISLEPRFSEAGYKLAEVHQMEGAFKEAIETWAELAAFDPGFRDVYSRIAIASYYIEDYAAAWKHLREADRRRQAVPPQFRGLLKEADPRP